MVATQPTRQEARDEEFSAAHRCTTGAKTGPRTGATTPASSVDQSSDVARYIGQRGVLTASLLRRRTVRYALVSVVSVTVAQLTLILCFGILHWGAVVANAVATAVATVPSYRLNRAWVWGKKGRSHLLKEVVPFWALTFLGLAVSTVAAAAGERWAAAASDERVVQTAVVSAATLAGFGIAWIGKFVVLQYVLFVPASAEWTPTLKTDGP